MKLFLTVLNISMSFIRPCLCLLCHCLCNIYCTAYITCRVISYFPKQREIIFYLFCHFLACKFHRPNIFLHTALLFIISNKCKYTLAGNFYFEILYARAAVCRRARRVFYAFYYSPFFTAGLTTTKFYHLDNFHALHVIYVRSAPVNASVMYVKPTCILIL